MRPAGELQTEETDWPLEEIPVGTARLKCLEPSRATVLEFESRGEQLVLDFACHVRKIAQAEGCDGKPIGAYIDLVRKSNHNLRACLMAVESGAMLN